MNLFYPILIGTIAFFLLTITSSYTQSSQEAISDVHIFVQIFVRDSDGNLVTYLESDKFTHKF